MNREIKFRQPIFDFNGTFREWFYWGIFHTDDNRQVTHPLGLHYQGNTCITDPRLSQQFTGLLDKNGKEIYKGDIIKAFTDDPTLVEWHSGAFGYLVCKGKGYEYFVSFSQNLHFAFEKNKSENIEVIGNIYENPELINK